MSDIETALQILDDAKIPGGEESYFILKDEQGYPVLATHRIQTYLAQEISKEVFRRGKGAYSVISTQKSLELSDAEEEYRSLANSIGFNNREMVLEFDEKDTILENGAVISLPKVKVVNKKELKYDLKRQSLIPVNIDSEDAIKTLVRAKVMKRPKTEFLSFGKVEGIPHTGLYSVYTGLVGVKPGPFRFAAFFESPYYKKHVTAFEKLH